MTEVRVITNVSAATMADAGYGFVPDAAIAIENGLIAWVGRQIDLPDGFAEAVQHDFGGHVVTPALIDCHTHIVHGGNRAKEFEMRLEGASYEEIARAGGGIVSTVAATRDASVDDLLSDALLRVARAIESKRPVWIVTSFLGAHAVPKGIDADTYIDTICIPTLEAARDEGLVDVIDGFCEGIAFDTKQISRVFDKAQSLGIPIKLHAEQLSHLGGTALAARHGALSVDHVEYATESDARLLSEAGSVAVVLPGAFYTLHETQKPPIAAFRDHGVPIAVATDWNPGSSPMGSVLLAMNMACTLFNLTPAEALSGVTQNAAKALGFDDRGFIAEGQRADLAIWDITDPSELSYGIGINPLHRRIFGGLV